MELTLAERIAQQEVWTFQECLGLSAEFGVKVRVVVVTVLASGKQYVDGSRQRDDESN